MTAGSLTAGENHADNLLLGLSGILTLLEGDLILSIGVGELCGDLFLICNALGCISILHADFRDTVSEHTGELGGILVSCDLQRGQFHLKNTP